MAEASRQSDKAIVIQTDEKIQVVGRNLGEKGDPGVGIAGESAQPWNPTGEWDSATAYSELDVVVHSTGDGGTGSGYICLQANTNKPPSTNATYWAMIVEAVEGPQGPGGEDMTSAVEVGVWRGAWNAGTAYHKNDLIQYSGSSYVCVSGHTASNANKPGSGAGKWSLFAAKGGSGSVGPRGEKGERGNPGPPGDKGDPGNRGPRGDDGRDGADGADGADAPVGLSLGPWTEARTLGFLNRSGFSIVLSNELKDGTGTIAWRRKNGSGASLPVTLANGDLYEVRVEGVSGRCYVGYKAERS